MRKATSTRKTTVCLLSSHPMVLAELERLLAPAGFHAGFAFPDNEPDIQLWTTIAADREAPSGDQPITEQRGAHLLTALDRLKPGVRIEKARADLDVIAGALAKQYPDTNTNFRRASVRPALKPWSAITHALAIRTHFSYYSAALLPLLYTVLQFRFPCYGIHVFEGNPAR